MKALRYLYSALLVVAIAVAFSIDAPVWARIVIIVWSVIPLAVNEYQLDEKIKAATEQEKYASNAVPDQMLHAYRENS